MLPVVLLLVGSPSSAVSAATAQSHGTGQWPQWRGPEGLGVTSDRNLPERWSSESDNIKWKTKIPGRGYSSPIVSRDRVFVTTAYESSTPRLARRATFITGFLLAAIFLATVLARWIVRRKSIRAEGGLIEKRFRGGLLNASVAGASTMLFFLSLVLMFVFPEQYDAVAGQLLAKIFGTYDTEHVFYVNKEVAAATWLNTGAAALLGFAASLYWLRAHSIWRLLGGLAFIPLAIVCVVMTPLDAWKYPVVLWTRMLFVVPGTLVALWHLIGFLGIEHGDAPDTDNGKAKRTGFLGALHNMRILWWYADIHRFGGKLSAVLFASLVALAAVVFVPVNLVLPQRGMHRAVVCLDFKTGEILWQSQVFTAPAERKHSENSYATPTPAADGECVVATFGVGVVCLDFDGGVMWKVVDPKYPDDTRYGASCSALLWRDRAVILQESEENTKRATWLAAFDKRSGDALWRIRPSNLEMAYTTGLLYNDGSMKLIVASFQCISCFDVESGHLLWQHKIVMKQLVASMARAGSVFCVGGGTWGPNGLIAFRVNGAHADSPVEELWQSSEDTPGCASPVIYRGILFTITDTGVMCAYDVVSGTLHWRKRLGGRYLASLVAGDGKVYACNTNGQTTVVAAEPTLRILGRNQLRGNCRASLAVADSHFLVRTAEFLYCIAPEDR